jgi:hypothetical protein
MPAPVKSRTAKPLTVTFETTRETSPVSKSTSPLTQMPLTVSPATVGSKHALAAGVVGGRMVASAPRRSARLLVHDVLRGARRTRG